MKRSIIVIFLVLATFNLRVQASDETRPLRLGDKLKTAREFWTSPELRVALEKYIIGVKTGQRNLDYFSHFLRSVSQIGLPITYLAQATTQVDLIYTANANRDPRDDDGDVGYLSLATPFKVNVLRVPQYMTYPNGSIISAKRMDATSTGLMYGALFNVYATKYFRWNSQLQTAAGIIAQRMKPFLPGFTQVQLKDAALEVIAKDIQYIINDWVLARNSILRFRPDGAPCPPEHIAKLKAKIYHPEWMHILVELEDAQGKPIRFPLMVKGTLQKFILRTAFGDKLTGDFEHDLAAALN